MIEWFLLCEHNHTGGGLWTAGASGALHQFFNRWGSRVLCAAVARVFCLPSVVLVWLANCVWVLSRVAGATVPLFWAGEGIGRGD